jgi:hypothetical protein
MMELGRVGVSEGLKVEGDLFKLFAETTSNFQQDPKVEGSKVFYLPLFHLSTNFRLIA